MYYEKLLLDTLNKSEIEAKSRNINKLYSADLYTVIKQLINVFELYNNFIQEFKRLKLEEIVKISALAKPDCNYQTPQNGNKVPENGLSRVLTNEVPASNYDVFKGKSVFQRLNTIGTSFENGIGTLNSKLSKNENTANGNRQNSNIIKKVYVKQNSTIGTLNALLLKYNRENEPIDTSETEQTQIENVVRQSSYTSQDLIRISNQEDENSINLRKIHESELESETNSFSVERPKPPQQAASSKNTFARRGTIFKTIINKEFLGGAAGASINGLNYLASSSNKHSLLISSLTGQYDNDLANQEARQYLVDEYTHEIKELKGELNVYKAYIDSVNFKLEKDGDNDSRLDQIIQDFQVKSNKIHSSEIDNLNMTFQSYKDFYEDELESRKDLIEKLLLRIDEAKLKYDNLII